MRMVKLDFGAERRKLERFKPSAKRDFYEVECPFCGMNQIVQTRKFHQGARCKDPKCRAMLCYCSNDATRDMLPRELTVIVHEMRTRIDWDIKESRNDT